MIGRYRDIAMTLIRFSLTLAAIAALAGCELIGNIFEAGMWVGLIIAVAILALIAFVMGKFRR